MIRDEEQRA
jgi:hypothetical protein